MNISVKEAAQHLGFSEQYIRVLIKKGRLPADLIGSTWVLPSDAIYNFLGKNEVVTNEIVDHARKSSSSTGINCLSFFSGAMGLDIGLEKAGFNTHLACEIDRASRETIAINRPDIALMSDIRKYTSQQILEASGLEYGMVDLMVGGPPCQAFSSAGKRQGFNDERGNVFLTFVDRILSIKPKYAIIENVRGLLSAALEHTPHIKRDSAYEIDFNKIRGSALHHILQRLKQAGYGVSFNLYNAANFGSPQNRERVILICSRDGKKLPFLSPTHSKTNENNLKSWITLREAIFDLKDKHHDHVNFPEKRLRYYRLLKDGQNWRNLPLDLQKQALGKSFLAGGGKTGFFRRLAWDKPCPTLVTHPAMPATDLCHPDQLRPLSIQEYKRIQEFPDSWEICGSKIDQYKQIGNAVPVSLGFAVGKLIMEAIQGKPSAPPKNFKFSRYRNTSHIEWEDEYQQQVLKVKKKLPLT